MISLFEYTFYENMGDVKMGQYTCKTREEEKVDRADNLEKKVVNLISRIKHKI